MTDDWRPELLNDEHELGLFDCGVPSMNQWLTGQARRAQQADTARTYVWADDKGDVVAYYSICPTQLLKNEMPRNMTGGFRVVPAYLLARLALDQRLHRQGYGGDLLVDALSTIVQASDSGAGRIVVVDAIDDNAVGFYEHYGFIKIRDQDGERPRLVMTVADARRNLGIASVKFTPNPAAQLGSIVLQGPDGSQIPTVVTLTELEAVMTRLSELSSKAQSPGTAISLNEVFREVLGRDLLAESE